MTTNKIPIKLGSFTPLLVFAVLLLGPMLRSEFGQSFQDEVDRQQEEKRQQESAEVSDVEPTPSQTGTNMLMESIVVRATELVEIGRADELGVNDFLEMHYERINNELWDLKNQTGVFDGDAETFNRVANLAAERQSLELARFWLDNPEHVHTAQGMTIDLNPEQEQLGKEHDYANIQP